MEMSEARSCGAWLVALEEKRAPYRVQTLTPGVPRSGRSILRLHPFGRMPAIEHGAFALYETQAILRYIDAVYPRSTAAAAGRGSDRPHESAHRHQTNLVSLPTSGTRHRVRTDREPGAIRHDTERGGDCRRGARCKTMAARRAQSTARRSCVLSGRPPVLARGRFARTADRLHRGRNRPKAQRFCAASRYWRGWVA